MRSIDQAIEERRWFGSCWLRTFARVKKVQLLEGSTAENPLALDYHVRTHLSLRISANETALALSTSISYSHSEHPSLSSREVVAP